MIELVASYIAWGLGGGLLFFLFLGAIFGLIRGLKRSALRLATLAGCLIVAFFLSPVLLNWIIQSSWLKIGGNSLKEWVDLGLTSLVGASDTAYLRPILPYLEDFAAKLVLAVVNVVVWFGLFWVMKGVSWLLYRPLAKKHAPKKNSDGERCPRHRWLGLLVGMAQGLMLFFFLLIPVNGLVSAVDQVATYTPLGGLTLTKTVTIDAQEQTIIPTVSVDVQGIAQQVATGLKPYQQVLRYTGLEYLSARAFAYETMVWLPGNNKFPLSDAVVKGTKLMMDVQELTPTVARLYHTRQSGADWATTFGVLDANDYAALRYVVHAGFDTQVLNFGNVLMQNLDAIAAASTQENAVLRADTQNWAGNKIYATSFYDYLLTHYADAYHREEFMTGVRAMVKYAAKKQLHLLEDDLVQAINLTEDFYTLTIPVASSTTVATEPVPVALALGRTDLPWHEALQRSLTTVQVAPEATTNLTYAPTATPVEVLFANLYQLQLFQIIAQPQAEQVITHSKLLHDPDLKTLAASFLGDTALQRVGDPATGAARRQGSTVVTENGSWWKVYDLVVASGRVVNDFYHEFGSLAAPIMQGTLDDNALTQEVLTLINNLVVTTDANGAPVTDAAVKYARVDVLSADLCAVRNALFAFPGLDNYLLRQINQVIPADYRELVQQLLTSNNDAVWQATGRSLANLSVLLSKAQIIATVVNSASPADALKALIDADVTPEELATTIHEMLQIDGINDKLESTIQNLDFGAAVDLSAVDLANLQAKSEAELTDIITELYAQYQNAA